MSGLFLSIFVGIVMASTTMLNGHGLWWALAHYSVGGTLTFLLFFSLVLRASQRDGFMTGASDVGLQDGTYRRTRAPFKK